MGMSYRTPKPLLIDKIPRTFREMDMQRKAFTSAEAQGTRHKALVV